MAPSRAVPPIVGLRCATESLRPWAAAAVALPTKPVKSLQVPKAKTPPAVSPRLMCPELLLSRPLSQELLHTPRVSCTSSRTGSPLRLGRPSSAPPARRYTPLYGIYPVADLADLSGQFGQKSAIHKKYLPMRIGLRQHVREDDPTRQLIMNRSSSSPAVSRQARPSLVAQPQASLQHATLAVVPVLRTSEAVAAQPSESQQPVRAEAPKALSARRGSAQPELPAAATTPRQQLLRRASAPSVGLVPCRSLQPLVARTQVPPKLRANPQPVPQRAPEASIEEQASAVLAAVLVRAGARDVARETAAAARAVLERLYRLVDSKAVPKEHKAGSRASVRLSRQDIPRLQLDGLRQGPPTEIQDCQEVDLGVDQDTASEASGPPPAQELPEEVPEVRAPEWGMELMNEVQQSAKVKAQIRRTLLLIPAGIEALGLAEEEEAAGQQPDVTSEAALPPEPVALVVAPVPVAAVPAHLEVLKGTTDLTPSVRTAETPSHGSGRVRPVTPKRTATASTWSESSFATDSPGSHLWRQRPQHPLQATEERRRAASQNKAPVKVDLASAKLVACPRCSSLQAVPTGPSVGTRCCTCKAYFNPQQARSQRLGGPWRQAPKSRSVPRKVFSP